MGIDLVLDARRHAGQPSQEGEVSALHRPEECTILGAVIRDDDAGLSLYTEQTGEKSIRGLSFIPRAMVKSVQYVTLSPAKPKP